MEAELLLAHVIGVKPWQLHVDPDRKIQKESVQQFEQLVARRSRQEPYAYITGYREFWSRQFRVTPQTLIPRPETELLVETALEIFSGRTERALKVLDAGTGSGILAVTLALELPCSTVIASDLSLHALYTTRENVAAFNLLEKVCLINASWLSFLRQVPYFDLVVSNPPYIAIHEKDTLSDDVLGYEPEMALFSGPDGLCAIRELLATVEHVLCPGGWFLCEIGSGQGQAAVEIATETGSFDKIEIKKDLAGHDRVLAARRFTSDKVI